jgi:beta-glucosidase
MSSDETRIDALLSQLTLEEKASLCSGQDFWNTKGIERLGIAGFMLTDGPHGLRKQASDADHLGLNESVPATAFPTGAGLASTWNPELIEQVGRALGREARAADVGVLLGPAVNIKRSPLGGRNFEYLSEDPHLVGELAAAYITGVQAQGVGTSLKHFAANNQEKNRLLVDVRADERTLREIYLAGFETAVTRAQPWTVMTAYNKLNGCYASEHPWLLDQVLRKEWGFSGVLVTDWGASNDRVAGLRAGLDLEMPGNGGLTDAEIVAAVHGGSLSEAELDTAVRRLLVLQSRVAAGRDDTPFDAGAHHRLAREAAAQGTVLLRNEEVDGAPVLPLAPDTRLAVIGAFAQTPRYQGGGSSHINPTRVESVLDALGALEAARFDYAPGYDRTHPQTSPEVLAEAGRVAADAEVAVVFVGLYDQEESEGYDRESLRLSEAHRKLIETVIAAQPRTVVVLSNGSAVEMPWAQQVPAIIEGYLGGQATGAATVDVLYGAVNPSGKLAETFPVRLEDNPSFLNFPGGTRDVDYREGVFIGYRYYDAAHVAPLFPFGHGLSYTTFSYSELSLAPGQEPGSWVARVTVTNTGSRAGAEVAQLYIAPPPSAVVRPVRELRGFRRVDLDAGAQSTVEFALDARALSYWDPALTGWRLEAGTYTVEVGSSSRDLRARATLTVDEDAGPHPVWDQNTALGALENHPVAGPWARATRAAFAAAQGDYDPDSPEARLVDAFSRELPLRALVRIGAMISQSDLDGILAALNGTLPPDEVAVLRDAANEETR